MCSYNQLNGKFACNHPELLGYCVNGASTDSLLRMPRLRSAIRLLQRVPESHA